MITAIILLAMLGFMLSILGIGTTAIVRGIRKTLRPRGHNALLLFGIIGTISLTTLGLPMINIGFDPIHFSVHYMLGGMIATFNVAMEIFVKVMTACVYIGLYGIFITSIVYAVTKINREE